jgi:hypothetical protein
MKERIEIVGVCTIKPIHEKESGATRNARENLKGGVGWSVRASLTADHDNATIRQDTRTRIPASCLYKNYKN